MKQYVGNTVRAYQEKAFGNTHGHADALLLKRTAFTHEHEVRLLYVDADRKFEKDEQLEVPFDTNSVIDEIMLDPRTISGGEPKRREWLQENGFKNSIKPSL